MKLAVSNIGWTAEEDATVAPLLRDAGAVAIEVAPGRVFETPAVATPEEARSFAANWADQGLPVASMQALLFGQVDLRMFGDAETQAAHEAYLAHIIALAGALGCGPLVYGSPRNRARGEMGFAQARDAAIPGLRRIGDIAEAHGCVFCLEANATGYGCDFMTTLAEAGEVARATDHVAVAQVVDTGNMLMEGEAPDAVDAVVDQTAHLHLSAPQLGPVHEQAAYVEEVITRLRGHGYDGSVTLEMRPGSGDAPLEDLLRATGLISDMIARG